MQRSLFARLLPFALILAPPAVAGETLAPPPGLRFTENLGQDGDAAAFTTRVGAIKVLFEPGAMVVHVPEARPIQGRGAVIAGAPPAAALVAQPAVDLTFRFVGADPAARLVGRGRLPGHESVYAGSDPSRWRTGLQAFGAVDWQAPWPGISLVFRERDGALHYDVVVEPGADLGAFLLAVEGADDVSVDAGGALVAGTARGAVRQTIPAAWEEHGGARLPVAARFVLHDDGTAGLCAPAHDPARRLVIDPGLDFWNIFSPPGGPIGIPDLQYYSIAIDPANGAQVVAGYLGPDAYVQSFDIVTGTPYWFTLIAGAGTDQAIDLCFDAAGDVYVCGITDSLNLPTTPGVFQPVAPGLGDAFVARINPLGAVVALTYVGSGGGSEATNPTLDIGPNGLITVAGFTDSPGFPIAPVGFVFDATYNGGGDAWVMQLNAALTGFVRSTYFGGALAETLGFGGVVVGPDNSVYLGGWTDSLNLPVVAAFDPIFGGVTDGFIAHLDPTLGALVFSTYRGGVFLDAFNGIDVDDTGAVWGAGYTDSPAPGGIGGLFGPVLDPTYNGNGDAFLVKHTGAGAWQWATFRGGSGQDSAMRVAVDRFGRAHWTGTTNSGIPPNPIPYPFTPIDGVGPVAGGYDSYIDVVGPDGDLESYSSYLNILSPADDSCSGIALDARGNAFVSGVNGGPLAISLTAPIARVTFPWFDEGFALAGTTEPQLMGDGTLVGGLPIELRVSNVTPGAAPILVVGAGPLFLPLRGGILVPLPNLLVGGLVAGAGGEAVLGAVWPFGMLPGTAIYMQAWLPDALGPVGFAASNGISTDTP